jgi:AsmA protein
MDQAPVRASRRSVKVLKYALIALAAVALAIGAVITYIAATFDPRDLHPLAVDLVREKTGRTLEIGGETELSFWPDVGVRLNALSLSERGSPQIFASIENARVTLELARLLRREIVVTDVSITGASVRVTRDENGVLNIADLIEGEGAPPRFDIGRIAIERSRLVYRDLGSGAQYELGKIAVETGRLAAGAVTPLSVAAVLSDTPETFNLRLKLRTTLDLDLADQRYALGAARLEVNGRVPGLSDLAAQAAGSAVVHGRTKRIDVSALEAAMSGTYGEEAIAVTLGAATLTLVPSRADGHAVRASLLAKGPAGTTEAKLDLPAVARDGERIEAAAAALDVALQRGNHRVQAAISTPLEGVLPARTLNLTAVEAAFTVRGPRLPGNGLAGALKGAATLDAAKEGVQVRLAGKVADSRVKMQLAATGFASPVYTFAVDVDRLDLDRYAGSGGTTRKPSSPAQAQELLEPLEALPASGTLTIGVLKAGGMEASKVKLGLK